MRWKKAQVDWPSQGRESQMSSWNCQTIAKATSCQDNTRSIGVSESVPTHMLIAFQCSRDNLHSNCFSSVSYFSFYGHPRKKYKRSFTLCFLSLQLRTNGFEATYRLHFLRLFLSWQPFSGQFRHRSYINIKISFGLIGSCNVSGILWK